MNTVSLKEWQTEKLLAQIAQLQSEKADLQKENSELRHEADNDALTSCLRRDAFMRILGTQKKLGLLEQHTTLAICDIDHFKKINDTHGHLAGDEALKAFARTLKQSLPDGSLVCRMGGEEFVVVIPGRLNNNRFHLEAFRNNVEKLQINTAHTHTPKAITTVFGFTVSVGAVEWNTDESMLQATSLADQNLYRAKNSGRNRLAA